MTNEQIKQQIDANNKIIQESMTLNVFILNNMVSNLLEENVKLQQICTHKFVDGYCDFCYKEEV